MPLGERMCSAELICVLIPACLVAVLCVPSAALFGWQRAGRPAHLPDTKTMTKWFPSTRLETRTKESNICASSRAGKPACAMKVTAGIFAPATDQSIERGLSMSISVRTRKMVNYACEGQSQGKLWWRLVAILTCKSFVIHGYRGERLIEPSSSWFPPKFPSG